MTGCQGMYHPLALLCDLWALVCMIVLNGSSWPFCAYLLSLVSYSSLLSIPTIATPSFNSDYLCIIFFCITAFAYPSYTGPESFTSVHSFSPICVHKYPIGYY
ncbi:hypothetical protein BDV28DRAFT_31321 [Aspergillus coremiiformis]|uniref:Uncharacterized protein n=1 Tax=Aspergillus coremiiformis TaxID=138285 RepID=A0A5N6YZE7_9EURO|nr:hypothetical protein BDV28DRAFT_31321 [Aspergillus coremiiformis]